MSLGSNGGRREELCPDSSANLLDHIAEQGSGHGWRVDPKYRSAGQAIKRHAGFSHWTAPRFVPFGPNVAPMGARWGPDGGHEASSRPAEITPLQAFRPGAIPRIGAFGSPVNRL